CPAPRVPDELYQLEQARSFARLARKDVDKVVWVLKYPAADQGAQGACEEIAQALQALLRDAKIDAIVKVEGLAPAALRKAVHERDYDLAYLCEESLDDPIRLALWLDPQVDATRHGGANYLGYDGDVKLQELLQAALAHRQFSAAQANMHAVHAHL